MLLQYENLHIIEISLAANVQALISSNEIHSVQIWTRFNRFIEGAPSSPIWVLCFEPRILSWVLTHTHLLGDEFLGAGPWLCAVEPSQFCFCLLSVCAYCWLLMSALSFELTGHLRNRKQDQILWNMEKFCEFKWHQYKTNWCNWVNFNSELRPFVEKCGRLNSKHKVTLHYKSVAPSYEIVNTHNWIRTE